MRKRFFQIGARYLVPTLFISLSACATAPRSPAGTLASAGISASSSFGSQIRDTSAKLEYADVTEAFVSTWDACKKLGTCFVSISSDANYNQRQELIRVIGLRSAALSGLGKAYSAMKAEADYDAKGDLSGATKDAVKGVNNFAAAVSAASGGAPLALLSEPLAAAAGFGAGLFADQRQRKRLKAANQQIGAATKLLRDALEREAFIFDSLASYLGKKRTDARIALLEANLVSSSDILDPLAQNLNMKLVPTADAIVAKSVRTQTAVRATVETMSRGDIAKVRTNYMLAIAALDALVEGHAELANNKGVSLADIDRLLGELDSAIGTGSE